MCTVDTVSLRSRTEESRVGASIMNPNCVQFRQSVRPNRTVSCLGTNMKNYAACERCMEHSFHPMLREYPFEVANGLLTAPGGGNPAGNSISLQLETMEEVKRCSSTHRKGIDNDKIDT